MSPQYPCQLLSDIPPRPSVSNIRLFRIDEGVFAACPQSVRCIPLDVVYVERRTDYFLATTKHTQETFDSHLRRPPTSTWWVGGAQGF